MKRLFLALLVAMVAPAFSQEMTYTDPTQIPIAEQTYTVIQQQTSTPIEDVRDSGGTPLTLYDDGVSQSINLGFDFYYYGNLYNSIFVSQNGFISFTSQANGCCSGNPLPSITEWTEQNAGSFQYINLNNSIFAMWSDLADFNNPGNPYYQGFNDRFVVGWYGVDELGTANKFTFEVTLFTNNDFMINYGAFDYAGPTGRTFTSGYQGDQTGESYQIYNGNDPSSLQNSTYLVQSSEVVPIPEDPIAPDCTINPYDPTCIINDITDPVDEPIMLADETTPIDEEEEDPVVEETFSAEETTETTEEEALEELLAENIDDEELVEDVMEESNAVYRELTDEEKAAILADAISKTTLESALSVASAVETAAVTQSVVSEITDTESSSRIATTLTVAEITSETTLSSIAGSSEMFIDSAKEELSSSESFAGADILEAGRQLGQAALNETLVATTESATDSMTQAESVALTSSSESQIIIAQTEASSPVETVAEEQSSTTEQATTEQQQESVLEQQQESTVLVAENEQQSSNETIAVIVAESNTTDEITTPITETPVEETIVADTQVASETQTESVEVVADNVQTEQSSVTYSDVESAMEVFASNLPTQITAAAEQEELENSIVQQAIASSQQTEDDNRMGFAEAEAVTIANDPALANAFNVQPNTASLELLGVLGSAGQDKSDAELRAEQVVAANKEEQDAINANYMEADQSGILAAIGSETDVSAYRTAMLRDNNVWYKPEDIYKGVIIKDNVRGSYFLEKGNTDTYKKMVDEQYK
jgi:hypothetical protein